jgi:proline dehydrogenase
MTCWARRRAPKADARRYHLSYSRAITAIARAAKGNDIRTNPGISVKLSALHPRYEVAKRDRVMEELVPRVRALAGWPRRRAWASTSTPKRPTAWPCRWR